MLGLSDRAIQVHGGGGPDEVHTQTITRIGLGHPGAAWWTTS
ncbi:MAG TPA: hypothetical protein VFI55_11805 [Mycobacterium sp.]|nr:hypothetical protein [Mycobacterium sp.]